MIVRSTSRVQEKRPVRKVLKFRYRFIWTKALEGNEIAFEVDLYLNFAKEMYQLLVVHYKYLNCRTHKAPR